MRCLGKNDPSIYKCFVFIGWLLKYRWELQQRLPLRIIYRCCTLKKQTCNVTSIILRFTASVSARGGGHTQYLPVEVATHSICPWRWPHTVLARGGGHTQYLPVEVATHSICPWRWPHTYCPWRWPLTIDFKKAVLLTTQNILSL